MSDHTNSPRLAGDALVLGPGAALDRDPTTTPGVDNTPQAVPELRVPQEPAAPQPPRLVSRSGQLQEQGFSVEVAERIAAPQQSSTRTIYKSKWALFEKWCRENSVDFSTPSVKQISDFFMYLYQDLNRRPYTIDGYRTAIVGSWAHRANILLIMRTFIGCSPVSTGIALKVPEISLSGTFLFIALMHPIQWTIAYPVGVDRPAKRQKKTSCVSTGQAGPVLCTRQMACRTSFLSRQGDVTASFSFGACTLHTNLFWV